MLSRVKRLLRQPHGTIHVREVVPALRVTRLQVNGALQQSCRGVIVPLDCGARAAFRIRGSIRTASAYIVFVIRKSVEECGKHGPARGAVAERVKRSTGAEKEAALEGGSSQRAEEVGDGLLRSSFILPLQRRFESQCVFDAGARCDAVAFLANERRSDAGVEQEGAGQSAGQQQTLQSPPLTFESPLLSCGTRACERQHEKGMTKVGQGGQRAGRRRALKRGGGDTAASDRDSKSDLEI